VLHSGSGAALGSLRLGGPFQPCGCVTLARGTLRMLVDKLSVLLKQSAASSLPSQALHVAEIPA